MELLTCTYIVERIDGDYAFLRREDGTGSDVEPKMVARALLPAEIMEGTRLLYEMLQYRIADE